MPAVWHCLRCEGMRDAIYRTLHEETPQSLSFSVSQGCEACSSQLSEQPACISPLPLSQAAPERESSSSFPHWDHTFRCQRAEERTGPCQNTQQRALSSSQHLAFWLGFMKFAVFLALPFSPPEENSIRVDLWFGLMTASPPLSPHTGSGPVTFLILLFCLLMGNTWPKSADIPTWWSHFYIEALKLKHYLKDDTWGSGSGWCFSSFLKTCFSPLRFTGKHIVRSETP